MELPQPRPYGAQGKPTHDFLSFYSQIQDPSPPEQGIYPKTHDFLQPLERVDNKNNAYEVSTPEVKPAGPAPSVASSSGEHVLPGGIGTYSIRNVSHFNQRILKPEKSVFTAVETIGVDNNEENSNCSSHTGRGFTLWEESAVKKGKTRKESHSHCIKGAKNGGQWGALERPSQSCSNIATTATTTSFSSRSSSQPELQKNQSFMDMLKSAKAAHDEDDEDEEEYALKKEASPPLLKGELTVRVGSGGGKNMDQKPNTPRSKHSATEQRRRSKINDRFHMLRELIPHSDQKRDKASFLLEVIEYIQYLQEKVHKYEGTYQGWNQELPKSIPWSSTNDIEGYVDQLPNQHNNPVPSMVFSAKFDENGINLSPANPLNSRKTPKSDVKTITQVTEIDHSFGLTTNEEPLMQENIFRPFGNASTVSQPQPQSWQGMPSVPDCDPASNKINEKDLTIESGVISISSAYSQGLLNTITQALQSSGVDMSQANISVQIDLGKRTNNRATSQADDVRYIDQVMGSPRGENGVDKPDRDKKRLRTS